MTRESVASHGSTTGAAVSLRLHWARASQQKRSADDSARQVPPNFKSSCLKSCTAFGTCNEELGRCDCPRNREGPNCSRRLARQALLARCKAQAYTTIKDCLSREQNCVNACNKRGECVAGFCHCMPGYYGSDCSLSRGPDGKPVLLDGQGYITRAKRPWIYVYELPPRLTTWFNFRRLDRPLHLLFWQRLLSSGARIADGDLADYYFIPVRQRSSADGPLLLETVEYIREHFPWWNRTGGGHRHLIIQTGDWGRVEAVEPSKLQQLTWNMTWLTHWGLTAYRRGVYRWSESFRPDKDVVIPVYISPGHLSKFGVVRSPLHPALAARAAPRKASTLFFAGRICGDHNYPNAETWPECNDDDDDTDMYSAGIRERVFVQHWNRTGFHLAISEPRYGTYLAQSVFCLAPPGAGHGQRQIQALFMGCVPVCVGDHIWEPFEPTLSWQDWGLRLPEVDIPRLHQVLEAISPEQVAQKQSQMYCAAQHMLYSSITGSVIGEDGRFDAFETTLEILRVKAAHPDAPPEQYRQLDADFDHFMDCKDPPGFRRGGDVRVQGVGSGQQEEEQQQQSESTAHDVTGGEGDGSKDAGGGSAGEGDTAGGVSAADDSPDGSHSHTEPEAAPGEGATRAGAGAWGEAGREHGDDGDGDGEGAQHGSGAAPRPAPPQVPQLCSHSAVDVHHRERSCYYLTRGAGYMGVPGGALCARGHRYRLGQCPRLWA